MIKFQNQNLVREEKRFRVQQLRQEKESLLKHQLNYKDAEMQKSVDRLNRFKQEHYQQKAVEKQLRMQVVKGQADANKKARFLQQKEKVLQKEAQIDEVKAQIDGQLEQRRLDLETKMQTQQQPRRNKLQEEKELKDKKLKLLEQEDLIARRIESQKNIRLYEQQQRAE